MEQFFDIIFNILIGYVIARLLFAWIDHRLTQKIEKELSPIIRDLDSGQLIPLTVELHNDEFLCYNSLTNDFVCQGQDLADIAKKFNLRYPGRKATIHRGDSEAIAKLKQQIRDGLDNISLPVR